MRDQIIMSFVVSFVLTALLYILMKGSLSGIGSNPLLVFTINPLTLFLLIAVVAFLYKCIDRR